MTKEELIEYLKENLTVECSMQFDMYGTKSYDVELKLNGEVISSSNIDMDDESVGDW